MSPSISKFREGVTVFLVLAVTGLSLGLLAVFIEEVSTAPAHFSFMSARREREKETKVVVRSRTRPLK